MFSLVLAGEDFGLKLENFSRKKICMLATSLMRCANLRFLHFDFGLFPLRLVYRNAKGVIDSPCHFKGSKRVYAKVTVVILDTAKITVNSWKLTQVLILNGNAFETVHFRPVMIRTQRRSLISVLKIPLPVNSCWMRILRRFETGTSSVEETRLWRPRYVRTIRTIRTPTKKIDKLL